MGPFTDLTDRLTAFLKPEPDALEGPEFFHVSTRLMFHVIAEAIAQTVAVAEEAFSVVRARHPQ